MSAATMPNWTPANLAVAPKFWLQADTLAGADGSTVSLWPDSSGNGNNPITYGVPTVLANGLDGKKVVNYPGPSTQGGFGFDPGFVSTETAAAVFLLFRQDVVNAAYAAPISRFDNHGDVEVWPDWSGNILSGFGSTVRRGPFGNGLLSNTNWNLVHIVSAPNDWRFAINGTVANSSSTNTVGWRSDGFGTSLGASNGGNNFDGQAAEYVFLPYKPTTEDEDRIVGYLAWKWGREAALPVGHPYKSEAPQAASGPAYRITGIGWMRPGFIAASLGVDPTTYTDAGYVAAGYVL